MAQYNTLNAKDFNRLKYGTKDNTDVTFKISTLVILMMKINSA